MASRRWIELERALYHRVRMNLVMSAFVRDSLVEDYGCAPSRVALVGAAPNLPAPAGLPANSDYSNQTVLFTGIDWERKGGPVLLQAFRRVLKELPGARLIIAGAAPAIDLPNVQVMGRVPLTEVSRLLSSACILALPSLREPQGIIAIEALMHGIPVIASNVGALAETVDDGVSGRVIAPGDAGALASAIIELLSNPALCRRYGEAGREIAIGRHSAGAVSTRMGDAIRAAIGPVAA
jgi:glycosyltransferase involved in cell wall biosynthesis